MTAPVRRVPFDIIDDDGDRVCVRPRHLSDHVWIDSWVADVLERLRGFHSVDEHIEDLRQRLGYEDDELRAHLIGVREAQLLLSWPEILAIAAASGEVPAPPDTLVVVACGRPLLAARALRSFVAAGAPSEVLIVDDSGGDTQRAMIDALRGVGVPARYAGQRHKRELVSHLVDYLGHHYLPFVELALHGPANSGRTAGANRNTAFLWTAGSAFVSVDDDTFAPLAAPGDVNSSVHLTGAFDPTELHVFDQIADALDLTDAARSPLDAHARTLGRALGTLELTAADAVSDDAIADLLAGRGRVRATMTGIAGDVAMATTHSYMFLDGSSRERLMDGGYEALRLTRAMRRLVRHPTVGRPGFFMTTCVGFDNREALPPMFPFDRFHDHLFAASLRRAEADAYVGWLPELARHQPSPRPRGDRASLFSPTAGIHTALHVMMATNAASCTGLVELGEAIEATGRLPAAEYRDFIEQRHTTAVQRRLAGIDHLRDTHDETPAEWAADLDECAQRWTDLLQRDDPSVPQDLLALGHSADTAWTMCQSAMRDFGAAIQLWPEIFEAARELRASGIPIGEPISSAAP